MKLTPVLCLTLTLAGLGVAAAQDSSDLKPPAVIQINREWLKPGKGGAMHDKSEAAFVNLMNKQVLYNFDSTFSGTHFVTPRSIQAQFGITF